MIPIIVIIIMKSILKIINPNNTPIKLNKTDNEIIIGVEAELNCPTRIKKIKNTAINKALLKNAISSACFSCSPVKEIEMSLGKLKFSSAFLI